MTSRTQSFNMCGYTAPRLDAVRIAVIGLGNRGSAAVSRLSKIEGVQIKALCTRSVHKATATCKKLDGTIHHPDLYTGDPQAWKAVCNRDDLDVIYITTPWNLHTPIAVYAMNHGKHALVEVPAAMTIDECWQLVETSEHTRRYCMMLENCCYDFFELMTLNLARHGFFGDIVHGEGAYIHTFPLPEFLNKEHDTWRLDENMRHNGNLYPTHGLGPVCQIMNVNRGDRMEYMVSISSDDFQMGVCARELAVNDAFYDTYLNKSFRGNINTSVIRTHHGRTIMIQHDVTSPRVYSRIHLISGTKACAMKYPVPPRISIGHGTWLSSEEYQKLEKQYTPEIVRKVGEAAKGIGGHGGMDFLMDWRTIDCLRNGLPLDQDVYDAALWSSIFPLSEWSVTHRSNSVDVPDFTRGSWKINPPVDLSMEKCGTTKVLL